MGHRVLLLSRSLYSAAKGTARCNARSTEQLERWAHDEKLDLLSLGIKYRTQSKVKLALSGLLNPTEGVIWLFCSSTSASYHCHTSNYKLICLKCKKGCTSFSLRFLQDRWKSSQYPSPQHSFDISSVSIYIFVIPFLQKRSRNVALLHR